MSKKLFLHIGTHKTGTTTIQHFLAANRQALRDQQLVYPDISLVGFKGPRTHHRLAHAIVGRPGAGTRDDVRRFFDELRRDLRDGEAAIVSSEAFYRHVLPGEPGGAHENAGGATRDTLPFVTAVRDCVGDFEVTVLVMLRRQDLFLESLYAEQVMRSNYVDGIDRFLEERLWLADYDARLATWAEVFGRDSLDVRVFDPAAFAQPIEREFLTRVGGHWDDGLRPAVTRNATLPRCLIEYKRALNGGHPRQVSTQYRKWLEALAASSPPGTLPDLGRYYLTQPRRAEVLAGFEAGNRRVAREHLGRDEVFDSTVPAAYAPPEELRPRHFRQITRRLLRSLA